MILFETDIKTHFHDVDKAGILFFSRFFEYCHIAYEEFISETFTSWNNIFGDESNFLAPLVHVESNFLKPVFFDETLHIIIMLKHIGTKSITFHYTIMDKKNIQKAEIIFVHSFIDKKSFQSIPIPEFFLNTINSIQ